jgi:hypothetical protein
VNSLIKKEKIMTNDIKAGQADLMVMQLMEIENFRLSVSQQNDKNLTFQEAVMLWISEGYADNFKEIFQSKKNYFEPAMP